MGQKAFHGVNRALFNRMAVSGAGAEGVPDEDPLIEFIAEDAYEQGERMQRKHRTGAKPQWARHRDADDRLDS